MGPDAGTVLTVPYAFLVNEGGGGRVLAIQGDSIRVEPPLGRSRTFSVRDAAGLTVGYPSGRSTCNVLFDAQSQSLCRFTATEKNGQVFFQYLRNHGVPFYRPDGQPLEPAPTRAADSEEPVRHTDMEKCFGPRFTLQLRRTVPIGALIGAGLFLGLVTFFAGFPMIVLLLHGGPWEDLALNSMVAACLFFLAGPWVYGLAKGELFPPALRVEGERVWLEKGFGGLIELRPEDMGGFRWDPSDECYILYSKQDKTLLKFSTRDDFGPQFMNFLTDHNIRLLQK